MRRWLLAGLLALAACNPTTDAAEAPQQIEATAPVVQEPVRFYWWNATDLVGHYRDLGFDDEAIRRAGLTGKRIEFHLDDQLLYVFPALTADTVPVPDSIIAATEPTGRNFSHVCPPVCP